MLWLNLLQTFWEKIDHFIKNPIDRLEYIGKGYNEVINNHTYFHRVRDIFAKLGLVSHAKQCNEVYQKIKERL